MAKPVLQNLCSNIRALFTTTLPASSSGYESFFGNTLEKGDLIIKYSPGYSEKMAYGPMATKQENTVLLERNKSKPPKLYKVMLLNDDYTTMDFVVEVLQAFFAMDRERAMQVMLKVHQEGSAVCGVYPKDIAETKVAQVTEFAKRHGHPLRCELEET